MLRPRVVGMRVHSKTIVQLMQHSYRIISPRKKAERYSKNLKFAGYVKYRQFNQLATGHHLSQAACECATKNTHTQNERKQ